jgi:hypothetical protein
MTEIVREDYREAMARLGVAVSIVTTDGPAGRAGFTASAVCSVTDEPPTLLVHEPRILGVCQRDWQQCAVCQCAISSARAAVAIVWRQGVRHGTVRVGDVVDARNRCTRSRRLRGCLRLPDRQCH